MFGSIATRCPIRSAPTPGPTATISPKASCPGTHGVYGGRHCPDSSARSEPQTPTTRTMTWPESARGSGQSSATRSDHGFLPRTTARIRISRDVEVLRVRRLAGVRAGQQNIGELHRGGDAAGVPGQLVVGELGGVGALLRGRLRDGGVDSAGLEQGNLGRAGVEADVEHLAG